MNAPLAALLSVVPAYLVGSIPFAFLVVKARAGVDIRTVGSMNVGATNAGRVLGFRYFLLVFGLDVLKGLLPALLLPRLIASLGGAPAPAWSAVLAALGAILGHNYPVYLRFRGGKGVATSLGAFAALDPIAGLAALVGFVGSLLSTRIVSISSIVGAIAYVGVHFARAEGAWGEDIVMSLVTLALLGMMIVRHRKNFARIREGTEPRVSLRRKSVPPSGKANVLLVAGILLVVASLGTSFYWESNRTEELDCGSFQVRQVARASTGHQRASRLTFFDNDRRLAVLCPRYCRVAIMAVGDDQTLEQQGEIELQGRPMAIVATADRLYVLERPDSDRRHLEPGWVESFDFGGKPAGGRIPAGINPDDLAITPDGRTALVVSGDRTAKDGQAPIRHLTIHDLESATPRTIGQISLGRWQDELGLISLSESGKAATVAIHALGTLVSIDLSDRESPRALDGTPRMSRREIAYPSDSGEDRILMPVASANESVLLDRGLVDDREATLVLGTRPTESAIELIAFRSKSERSLGLLRLRGPFNLGEVHPLGVAWSPERKLVAVASKSGAVHLLALEPKAATVARAQGESPGSSLR